MDQPLPGTPRPPGVAPRPPAPLDAAMPRIYDELRNLAGAYMAREQAGHTLQATAVANEAYLRLREVDGLQIGDRTRFLALAATMIRRILVDHARAARAAKRGGDAGRLSISTGIDLSADDRSPLDVLALDAALESLAAARPRAAQLVELRFFGGLTMGEVAAELGVSDRTAANDWTFAQAWLRRALDGDARAGASDASR